MALTFRVPVKHMLRQKWHTGHTDWKITWKISEDDSKHWMTPKIRYDIYSFFMKHFNIQGDPSEEEAEYCRQEELKVTPTGQISTSFGGDMIFDVNRRETEKLMEHLERSRKDIEKHLGEVKVKAKEISGFIAPFRRGGKSFPERKVSA